MTESDEYKSAKQQSRKWIAWTVIISATFLSIIFLFKSCINYPETDKRTSKITTHERSS